MKRFLLTVLVAVLYFLVYLEPADVGGGNVYPRVVTYYLPSVCTDNRCLTYSGVSAWSIEGAAACGWSFPLWTRLHFEGTNTVITCIDRGAAWHFYSTEVDLFVPSHAEGMALVAYLEGRTVEVVE